jgi:hypothetical protein
VRWQYSLTSAMAMRSPLLVAVVALSLPVVVPGGRAVET